MLAPTESSHAPGHSAPVAEDTGTARSGGGGLFRGPTVTGSMAEGVRKPFIGGSDTHEWSLAKVGRPVARCSSGAVGHAVGTSAWRGFDWSILRPL